MKRRLGRWEYYISIAGLALTIGLVVAVVLRWDDIRHLQHYGYLGAFLISIFGGATIIAPIPMTPVIFALGTVTRPDFAPYLGPVFVGVAAGIGETIGGISIYMTGYGGGTAALNGFGHSKLQKGYHWLMSRMERRGSLVLFAVSAVVNPFFYPTAIVAGATHFKLRKYLLICLAGKTIKGISVAAAGYWGLGSILRSMGIPI